MCEATAYLVHNGQEQLLLESIEIMEVEGAQIRLVNFMGEEKRIRAKIKALCLVDHKIILEAC